MEISQNNVTILFVSHLGILIPCNLIFCPFLNIMIAFVMVLQPQYWISPCIKYNVPTINKFAVGTVVPV
jgi:hypothetical protein